MRKIKSIILKGGPADGNKYYVMNNVRTLRIPIIDKEGFRTFEYRQTDKLEENCHVFE